MTKRCYYGFVPEIYVKQINVILWLLILCLMKRYVDVKKNVIKMLISFYIYKKKTTQSRVFVILNHLFSLHDILEYVQLFI